MTSLEVLCSMEETFHAQNVIHLRMPRTTVRMKAQRRPQPRRRATGLTCYSPAAAKIRQRVHLRCRELDQPHAGLTVHTSTGKSMSPFRKIAVLGCVALSLAGCNDKKINVTIPSGSILYSKLYHLGDPALGSVLPTEQRAGGFGKVEYEMSQALAGIGCVLGIPLEWNKRELKHLTSTSTLSCDGVDQRELKGYVVGEDGNQGMAEVKLGGLVRFVVTETVTVK